MFRKVTLLRQWHTVKYADDNSITSYIVNVMLLAQPPNDIGIGRTIADDELTKVLLTSLPSAGTFTVLKCYYCGKEGHIKPKCNKLKRDKGQRKKFV